MIQLEELANFLVTIRNAIASDIQPDLRSAHIQAETANIIKLLDRIVTGLQAGDAIAAARLGTWERIRADIETLGFASNSAATPGAVSSKDSREALRTVIDNVQQMLKPEVALVKMADKLRNHDQSIEEWYAQAVAALVDLAEAGEPRVIDVQSQERVAAPAEEEEQLRSTLGAYLRSRHPGLPQGAITRLQIAPGGHVKQTAIFSLVPNDVLPTNLALRRDLAHSITGTSVVDEYPIIQRAFEIGLPVPEPILLEADQSVLGGSFMIMTEVTDAEAAGTYFAEERRHSPRTVGPDFGHEVATVLARLHTATPTSSRQPVSEHAELVKKSYEAWRALPSPPFSLGAELSYAWLLSHPLPPDRPCCLIHGDFGTHNILVRDGHLAALLDWELAHEGDPAEDLAECRMMLLPDVMPWKEFAQEYVAAGGDPVACDENSVAYYCIWTYLKHGLMNASLRDVYLRGDRDDVIAATVAGHYYYRLMQYQARALQIAVDASQGQ